MISAGIPGTTSKGDALSPGGHTEVNFSVDEDSTVNGNFT